MYKHLAVLTIFLAIFCHCEVTPGQSNISSVAPRGDGILAATVTVRENKTEEKTKNQDVSRKAVRAKRLTSWEVRWQGRTLPKGFELFQRRPTKPH